MAAKKKTEVKKPEARFAKASVEDFATILRPVITEKTMALMQEKNKVTFRVKPNANKAQVKLAFERVFGVKATEVNILNVLPRNTRRGGRYEGKISGYKKAIVTVAEGEALDLFKE
ncbi:MAG: 50S ribosomal protein L23 [Bacilli bacterium]|jgi:large subunit ribosomal protein L23